MAWIGHTLETGAVDAGDRPALVWRGGAISGDDVRHRVDRIARALVRRTPAGGRIAIDLPNRVELPILVLAAARAGRAAMVHDRDWPQPIRERVVAVTAPDLIVSDAQTIADLLAAGAEDDRPLPPPDPDGIFYVCFTSGATGTPKGCARSHESWLATFDVGMAIAGIADNDRVLTLGSFAHSIHLYAALEALHHGVELAFLQGFRPADALTLARERTSTIIYGTPAHHVMMAETAARRGLDPLPAVRRLLTGGAKWQEATPAAVRRLFPNARIVEFYGASETSFITAAGIGDAAAPGSVGRPVAGVHLQIRRPDGATAAPGEDGEIWVRSPMLFSGYACGDDPETRRDGPWLTIGDQGHVDRTGALFLAGRRRRMIVSAARNVFAEEVEAVLRRVEGVLDIAVFGLPDPLRGEMIVAAIRAEPAAPVDEQRLRAACRATLDESKVPRRIVRLDHWPLTGSGKPDLQAIRHETERRLKAR